MPNLIGLRDYVLIPSIKKNLFAECHQLDFDGIELVPTQKEFLKSDFQALYLFEEYQKKSGLAVPCISLSSHHALGVLSENKVQVKAVLEEVRLSLKWAQRLNSTVVLFPFFGQASLRNETIRKCAISIFCELCAEAKEKNITLAYEGDLPASVIRSMATQINSEVFACYFDLANPMLYGLNPVKELETLGSLIASVHVKDFKDTLGDCRPGQGCVPLAGCAQALREINYKGWLILETPPAHAEVVANDLAYVREVFLNK